MSQAQFIRAVFWLRYVDDIIGFSNLYCVCCVKFLFASVYAEPLSFVFERDGSVGPRICEWLDLELHVFRKHIGWILKNPTRAWIFDRGARQKSSLLPWLDQSPTPFARLKGQLLGKSSKCFS